MTNSRVKHQPPKYAISDKFTLLLKSYLRNILSLRPRKKANSSSAAGIPPFSQAIATAGTLGKEKKKRLAQKNSVEAAKASP
ncbi:hypothetical protein CapIbe_003800 [Capra ibex]